MRGPRAGSAAVAAVAVALTIGGCGGCRIVDNHRLAPSNANPTVGEEVEFTATYGVDRASSGWTAGRPRTDGFDLDGDGDFETQGNPIELERSADSARYESRVRASFPSAGTFRVGHYVVGDSSVGSTPFGSFTASDDDLKSSTVTVVPPDPAEPVPPAASFTVSPNPVRPERAVTVDASASRPGGASDRVSRYQ